MAEMLSGSFVQSETRDKESEKFITKRMVIKTGSSYFIGENGLDLQHVHTFTQQVRKLYSSGVGAIHICSGATALGRFILGDKNVPKIVAAAVGQYRLVEEFDKVYRDVRALQVLISNDDFYSLEKNKNNLLLQMDYGVVMINGNDSINTNTGSTTDNDSVTAHLAQLVSADTALFLTNTAGVLDTNKEVISSVKRLEDLQTAITQETSTNGTGGMWSKVEWAFRLAQNGVRVAIAGQDTGNLILQFARGGHIGTRFEQPEMLQ